MVIKKMKGTSIVSGPIPGNDIDCLRQNLTRTGIIWFLGDDDDDDGYDGEDDGANDVMIGDQNDDYYRHNSSNRHEASLVV